MCARMSAKRNYWKWKFSNRHFQIQIHRLYLHKLAVAHRHFASFINILCQNLLFLSQSSWDKLAMAQLLSIKLLGDPLMVGSSEWIDCFIVVDICLPWSLPMCREYCIREHCWRDQREKEGEKIQPVEALGTIFIIHYIIIRGKSTGCPKKNALSELCGICVGTKFFGYFEQASLQPSF